ncbi:MAG: fibronectin type III domain-containing protein, partial [Treponema sp.]|nr:fibronectin type III domain-containing protein [Treponema sp.]
MKKVLSMAVLICSFGLLISGCKTEVSRGLDVPKGLKAQAESHTGISLTWTPVDGAGYYKVYRTTDSAWKEYPVIQPSITTSTYSDNGLSADTTYYYKVSAHTGMEESDKSETVSATTFGRLDTPKGLKAQAESQTSISLTWTPVDRA